MKFKGPNFSRMRVKRSGGEATRLPILPLLGGFLGLLLLLMAMAFGYVYFQNKFIAEYRTYVAEQKLLSQRMATSALEAAGGKDEAFGRLQGFRDRYQQTLDYIKFGNPEIGLPAITNALSTELQDLEGTWEEYRANIDSIVEKRSAVSTIAKYVADVSEALVPLERLSEDTAVKVSEGNNTGANSQTLYVAARQSLFIERARKNLNQILSGSQDASTAADQFGRDFEFYARVVDGLVNGSRDLGIRRVESVDAQNMLVGSQEIYNNVQDSVVGILDIAPDLFEVKDAAAAIEIISPEMLDVSVQFEAALSKIDNRNFNITLGGLLAFLLSLLLMGAMGTILVRHARSRATESSTVNQRNQEAILRLLDEMAALAEGDLTAHATVTEDITGAIADSVNFSIDALRSLVEAINNTVVRVSQSSEYTQAIANRLADASNQQATEIANTTSAISNMAETMEQVSKNASNSAEVALKSVEIANKGAETVRRNIEGMDTIRETIQETSKRIKRLGESSQQIGEIISLITDIADRTNILALNAAIQASSAGEAGRGFAVVADEVQRLAERAGNATKQISALVETIQTDTNEAVSSMEQSTAGVVTGAKLAEDAGNALNEIESVSSQLADLIQDISREASEQASNAINISESMHVIQQITMETSEGTNETALSIGNLTELANELNTSISGFKLPDSGEIKVAVNE